MPSEEILQKLVDQINLSYSNHFSLETSVDPFPNAILKFQGKILFVSGKSSSVNDACYKLLDFLRKKIGCQSIEEMLLIAAIEMG